MIPGRISNDKRNELYEEVWKAPVRQLAKAEGVSDVALRKRLAKFDIPLPPRGYWAKSEENRQKIVPPLLPDITRLTSNYVFGYSICRIDADSLSDDQLKNDGPFLFITEESVQRVQQFCESLFIEKQLRNPTTWVQKLITRIEEQRKKEKEEYEKYRYQYWYTQRCEQVVPFDVPECAERRVLRILDTLDKRLYEIEGSVDEGTRYWDRGNKLKWYLKLDVPSGSFYLHVEDMDGKLRLAFMESYEDRAILVCEDTEEQDVESQLGKALYELCLTADKSKRAYELKRRYDNRKYEIDAWRRKMEKIQQAEAEYRAFLSKLIDGRAEATKCRAFANSLEAVICQTEDVDEATLLKEFKVWVEDHADAEDPFIHTQNASEVKDVWGLAELIRANRERQRELLENEPHYSAKELGR